MEQIKLLRQRKGMTQKELAEKLRVSQQNVSRWETGEVIPRLNKLKLIAEALECTIDELCRDK